MKEISNTFIIVGTNPYKHIKNFLISINRYEIGHKFYIDDENNCLRDDNQEGEIVFQENAKSTINQNYRCWIAFEFVIKVNKFLIKICEEVKSTDELLEISKCSLLKKDSNYNHYKNTILIKILFLINIETIKNIKLFTRKNQLISHKQIKKEIGIYEKEIIKDEQFLEMIKILKIQRS